MAIGTLNAIFGKIRRLTGRGDQLQLPDYAHPTDPNSVGLADYVNSFYNYDFPAAFRSLKLKDVYTFNTVAGIDTYPFNSEQFTTVEMPCYVMKREVQLFTDMWSFYGAEFNWQQQTNFAYSNGSAGPYSGYTTAHPIIRSVNNNPADIIGTPTTPGSTQGYSGYPAARMQNILITAKVANGNSRNVTDDGAGNLIGNCVSGSINYDTGQVTNLVFDQVIPAGQKIQIQYNPVTLQIPLAIGFFQNSFILRPVPDQGYTVQLTTYRQPTQALAQTGSPGNKTGTPELNEWWECLAVGAAKKVYEDDMDLEGMAAMDKLLDEKYNTIMTRTYAQLGSQQIQTIYRDQLSQNYGTGGGWGFGGGSV